MEEKLVGKVTHYFDKIGVAVMKLEGSVRAGDTVHVKGKNADFTQQISSMQIDRKDIEEGKAGDEIAIKTAEKTRGGDEVYLVS